MKNMYGLLAQFSAKTPALTRKSLVRMFSEELVDEALRKGYIVAFDKTDIGEVRYIITDAGREARDK